MADDAARFAGRIDLSVLQPGGTLQELTAAFPLYPERLS